MTAYAELVYRQPGTDAGAVVGVVEVFSTDLRVVARRVMRCARAVALELPAGRYLADAGLPSGEHNQVPFTAGPDATSTWVELPGPGGPPIGTTPTGWLLALRHRGAGWSPAADLDVWELPGVGTEVILSGPGDSTSAALMVGGDMPAVVVVVPVDAPLRMARADGGWTVVPAPGAEATMLAYLHRGDLTAARVVAEELLAEATEPGMTGSSLLDVVLGYHLLRTGDERLHDWAPALVWHQPLSVDAAILHAWQQMRGQAPSETRVRADLLRAAGSGLPVLAPGMRLLANGLSLLDVDGRIEGALSRVRPYLLASQETAGLTTFVGAAPDAPGRILTDRPVSAAVRAFGGDAMMPPHAGGAEPPGALPTAHAPLVGAIPELPDTPVGPRTPSLRRPVGGGALNIAVVAARGTAGAFDVHLTLDGGDALRGSWTGATAVLRADPPLHYLATFDEAGAAAFHAVPSGAWRLRVRPRRTTSRTSAISYAMPPLRPEEALVAAPPGTGREVFRALTPGGRAELILWASGAAHAIEVITRVDGRPVLVAVDYETDAGTAALLIPLAAGPAGLSSGYARLDGFLPDRPWSVSEPADAAELTRWPAHEITRSARAAAPGTHRAWRHIAAAADPSRRAAIEDGLHDEW